MWSRYVMNLSDYKHHFKEDTELREETYDFVELSVRGIENKEDKPYEFSIEWKNNEVDEGGFIYKINTSSVFAFNSCSWCIDDESEPSDNNNEVPLSDGNKTKELREEKGREIEKGIKRPVVLDFS